MLKCNDSVDTEKTTSLYEIIKKKSENYFSYKTKSKETEVDLERNVMKIFFNTYQSKEIIDHSGKTKKVLNTSEKKIDLSEQNVILSINNTFNNNNIGNKITQDHQHFDYLGIFYYETDDQVQPQSHNNNSGFFIDLKNEDMKEAPQCKNTLKTRKKIYFDVYYKSDFKEMENNFMDNLILFDITHIMHSKEAIINEYSNRLKHFAKIAHEFKTPLSSVIGIASNIKDTENSLSNKTNIELEIIQDLSNYLTFLVSDVIQFSKISNFLDVRIEKNKVNVAEILQFCFHILNSLLSCYKIKKKNIKTELILIKDLENILIESDEIRIKQILLNFISNAVKFTKTGSIILKTKIIEDQYNSQLKISVKDTGIGIKNEDRKNLLEEYNMIENNETNKINNCLGSGLGLSICKLLSEKMNVKLNFKSVYTKGSSFYIILPIKSFTKSKKDQDNSLKININLSKSLEVEKKIINDEFNINSNRNLSLKLRSVKIDDKINFSKFNSSKTDAIPNKSNRYYNINQVSLFSSSKHLHNKHLNNNNSLNNKNKLNFFDFTKINKNISTKKKLKTSQNLVDLTNVKVSHFIFSV